LTEDDEWQEPDPPPSGPSKPPDLDFDPVATGLGVFAAVAIPIVVVGYTRSSGVNGTIIAVGVVIGLLAGFLAGLWVASRGGRVYKGPRL
jgi:hypothetical protein